MIVTGAARLAGVIGWPVAHSRSPQLHNYWLAQLGIDGVYIPLAVAPRHFHRVLRLLPRMGFAGANVTLPHKRAALAAVDESDALARRIGAVNTVTVGEDGTLHGANTDGFGFMESLRQGAPSWAPGAGPAVILGAGGTARAVAVALADAGAPQIRIVNRTKGRATRLARAIGPVAPPDRVAAPGARARGRGTGCQHHRSRNDRSAGAGTRFGGPARPAVVSDTVYTPLETPLLAAAAARGHAVVDGLGMLLHQARPGFSAWFGVAPEVTRALREAVLGARHTASAS